MTGMILSHSALKSGLLPLILVTICLALVSCDSHEGPRGEGGSEIRAENAFPELTFNRPLGIENAGDGSNRLFVVEQRGTIQVITPDPRPLKTLLGQLHPERRKAFFWIYRTGSQKMTAAKRDY